MSGTEGEALTKIVFPLWPAVIWIAILLEFVLDNLQKGCFKNEQQKTSATERTKVTHLPFLFGRFWLFLCKYFPVVSASPLPSSFQPRFWHAHLENPPKEEMKKKVSHSS